MNHTSGLRCRHAGFKRPSTSFLLTGGEVCAQPQQSVCRLDQALQTTFADPSGSIEVLRVDQDGNEVLTNSNGETIEFNPLANTSSFIDAEGNTQISERTENGGYLITLEDGTVLELDPTGKPLNSDTAITETDSTLSIDWEANSISGNAVGNVEWDKETNTLSSWTLEDNTFRKLDIDDDGSLTMEVDGETFKYDPATGVTGVNDIFYELGETIINTSGAGSATISEDGMTFTVDYDGVSATAVTGATGVTVEIDGEIYEFSY